jgi:bifunctional non-homologous end joining protein LigD
MPVDRRTHGAVIENAAKGTPSFQALQHRGANPTHHIVFYAFDVLHIDGRDVTGEPLTKRRARLPAILDPDAALRLSQELPGNAADVVAAVRAAGLEGVIAKRKDSTYQPGERSSDWLKLKLERQQEFVIGGYRPGGAAGVDACSLATTRVATCASPARCAPASFRTYGARCSGG